MKRALVALLVTLMPMERERYKVVGKKICGIPICPATCTDWQCKPGCGIAVAGVLSCSMPLGMIGCVGIAQNQNNFGIQVGEGNFMNQKNIADAELDVSANARASVAAFAMARAMVKLK